MVDFPDYDVGTVSITTGTKVLTGTNTFWLSAGFEQGDEFGFDGYPRARIDEVTDDGAITLLDTWRGPTLTDSSYYLRSTPEGSKTTGASNKLRIMLSQPLLAAFAALTGAADKMIYFTGASTMALADFGANARSVLANAKAWLASFAGLTMAADQLPYGTGANTMGLADFGANARSVLANAKAWLASFAGLTMAADQLPYGTGANTIGLTPLTGTGRAVIASADAATARTVINAASATSQTFTGRIEAFGDNASRGTRASTGTGAVNTGGTFTSSVGDDVFNLRAQFFGQEIVGTGVRAGIAAQAGGSTSYLLFTNGGNLSVPGSLSKGSGTFLIDHPLDPLNKDLAHGFVEAPRYELIYRGRAKLINGHAVVDIDAASNMTSGTFDALTINADVTSLQNQNGFARCRATAIHGASFEIICEDEASTDEVAWVVIAERNDAFVRVMDDNCDDEGRFIPERDKDE